MRVLHLSQVFDSTRAESEDSIFSIPVGLPRDISPVRELTIQASNILDAQLEMIAACAHLDRFEYQHHNQLEWAVHRNYRCRPLHPALLLQNSLRELRLNGIGATSWFEDDNEDGVIYADDVREPKAEAWFGSLVEFVALRDLRMPLRNLLDSTDGKEPNMALAEILPPGLEVLVLRKLDFIEYSMHQEQLKHLLGVREPNFPGLRNILLQPVQMEAAHGMECPKSHSYWRIPKHAEVAFAGIRSICAHRGVEFGFFDGGD
ncbi:hypothetical protein BJX76DRAFT_362983 [Aspergillus varians]